MKTMDILFLKNGVGDGFVASTKNTMDQKWSCNIYIRGGVSIYIGSRGTYPRDTPRTSLTTISKLANSIMVTASNATSSRTSDHSKKA